MRSIKLNTRLARRVSGLVVVCLLLGACGLAGGQGNLESGARYQDEGQYRAAYIEAKKVLQRDEKNGNAWLLLGRASLMLGNPNDALSDLQKAKADGVPKAKWAEPMGQALLVMQQYDKALEVLTPDASFDDKDKARVAALRGDALRGLEKPSEAEKTYKSALALNPKDARALVGLARLAATADDPESASRYVQQALATDPKNPQAWVARGDLAFDRGDFASAEAAYQKVIDFKNPAWLPQEYFYTLARLVNAQVHQNQLDKALVNVKTLEKMSPQQPYPHYLHAMVLYQQGHMDDAVTQLQKVLKAAPDNVQAQLLMGAVNYAQGNYGQAEMYLSNVLGVDQKNVGARRLLALAYYREGLSRQALDTLRPTMPGTPSDAQMMAILQHAAAEVPGKPGAATSTAVAAVPGAKAPAGNTPADTRLAQARRALASGDAAGAIDVLKAMPAGDAATEARRTAMLVMAYTREKRTDEAVKTAADYAGKHPDESSAHVLYGTALIAADKHDEARTQYDKAVKLDPGNAGALMNLASLDVLEGHYKDATGHYHTVLEHHPHNAAAMTALGRLAAIQGNKADAIKWYKQAIEAAPRSTSAYGGLVALYSESGQFDKAVDVARRLVKAVPDDPAALNALGATQLNAGHQADALKPLQQAVNLAPQVALYRTNLARAQIVNKDSKAARENLERAVKADPGQVTASTLLAYMKLRDKDLPGALALARTLQKQSPAATKAAGFMLEGDLYRADKSYDKAAKAYQQGLKVRYDRSLVIKTFLALNQAGEREPERVLRDWLTKHPEDAGTRLLLAQYYLESKRNPRAVEQYEKVRKAYPTNVTALNNLAWIYIEQHNPKALELAKRAYKLAPDSANVADTYGWALIAAKQPKTALPILAKAAKAAPKVPDIQYHLAVAQAHTGDHTGARATLEALRKSGADFADKPAAEKLYEELGGASAGSSK